MPRPDGGYRNRSGTQVPGVHDILKDYIPKDALVPWAYSRGRKGLPLYEKATLDIGTAVHAMAELDLKGRPSREIEGCAHASLSNPNDIARAWQAFEGFCRWRESNHVRSIAHEVSLISDFHQLGGTPDCIAFVGGEIGLLDFKTCTKVPAEPYREQLLAMSAHGALWNEAYPDRPIRSHHIVYLPKDGSAHRHHAFADLSAQWVEFRHLLAAFAEKHGAPKPLDPRDEEIARLKADLERASAPKRKPRTVKPAPKTRLKEPAPVIDKPVVIALPPRAVAAAPMTMAEILRSYGHVRT